MKKQQLRLIDLSVSSSTHSENREVEQQINLNEETGTMVVSLAAVYQLIGDVYRGCDYFCQAFEERYPSQAALCEEIEAYKAWRRQVESGRSCSRSRSRSASATEALAGRCAAPMYLVAVVDEADGQEPRLVGFVRLSPSKVPRQGHTAGACVGVVSCACAVVRVRVVCVRVVRNACTCFNKGADGLEVHPAGEGLGEVEPAPPDQAVLLW